MSHAVDREWYRVHVDWTRASKLKALSLCECHCRIATQDIFDTVLSRTRRVCIHAFDKQTPLLRWLNVTYYISVPALLTSGQKRNTCTLKLQSSGPLYSSTLAVVGWAVTFGTAMRGIGELRPRPVPSSLYQM